MRSQRVTGAYIVLNNHNLDDGIEDKPGVYLRDFDPMSKSSSENGDILIERAPEEVVKSLNIATDSAWRPRFEFQKENVTYYDFSIHHISRHSKVMESTVLRRWDIGAESTD